LERELSVALSAARDAAALVMRVYASDFGVEFKGRNDPVTEADREANALIVHAIGEAFPGDAICAEENSADDNVAAASRGGRCWFVDPLDGTREFVSRNGEFCVMVGLAIDGVATLGAVIAPAWNRTLWGVTGEGAFERGVDGVVRTLAVRASPDDPRHARMVVSRSHLDRRVMSVSDALGVADVRRCGSVGLKVALVASGEADLYVHAGGGPKLWDGCAPDAIARSAGALVTDGSGAPLRYDQPKLALDRGIIVASGALHTRAVDAFSKH
jgi:3'(2'), 5'-bisphosphate nucleotidase